MRKHSGWVDWLHPEAGDYWISEMMRFHNLVPFDAVWIDLNEVASGCSFSCGGDMFSNSSDSMASEQSVALTPRDPRSLNFPPYKLNK